MAQLAYRGHGEPSPSGRNLTEELARRGYVQDLPPSVAEWLWVPQGTHLDSEGQTTDGAGFVVWLRHLSADVGEVRAYYEALTGQAGHYDYPADTRLCLRSSSYGVVVDAEDGQRWTIEFLVDGREECGDIAEIDIYLVPRGG